jgi:hypothetical protein
MKSVLGFLTIVACCATPALADLVVGQDLGTVSPGTSFRLTGDTTGLAANCEDYTVSTYKDLGAEMVYQFTLTANTRIWMPNPEGNFVGVDHDHYILDDLTTTYIDPYNTANGLAFLDEAGTFGDFGPGTYYLSVDGYSTDGPFDIILNAGTMADFSQGTLNPGDVVTGDTSNYPNAWSGYGFSGYDSGDGLFAINHPGGTLDLLLEFDDANYDFDMRLYDDTETFLEGSYLFSSPEQITADYPAGTYYVLFDDYNESAGGAFTLTYTPEPASLLLLAAAGLLLRRR